MRELPQQPKKGVTRNVIETVVEAGLNAVPFVGGAAAVITMKLVGAKFAKRQQDFLDEILRALQDLMSGQEALTPERLATNDEFVDALLAATMSAQLTSQQQKLDALRNAVLNVAAGVQVDADMQAIFIRQIQDLTPSHLRLLRLLDDPPEWFREHDLQWPDFGLAQFGQIIEAGIPEFAGRQEFYDLLAGDLAAAGLSTGSPSGMLTANGLRERRTSDTGRAFLDFISDPRARLGE